MDTEKIAARYAKALYDCAIEWKEEDVLFEKMKELSEWFKAHKSLQKLMKDSTVSSKDKQKLLIIAGGSSACKSYCGLLDLLAKKRKEFKYAQMIASSFQKTYKKEKGIITSKLTTAIPVKKEEEITQKIETIIKKENKSKKIDLDLYEDDKIIGGFILDIDYWYRLDISVKSQLSKIKRQLIEE